MNNRNHIFAAALILALVTMACGVNAQVTFDGGLTTVNTDGGWGQHGDVYSLSGSCPTITITVKIGMDTLNLKTE